MYTGRNALLSIQDCTTISRKLQTFTGKGNKKHVPLMNVKMSRENIISLSEELTAVIAEKKWKKEIDGRYSLKTRHRKTTDFIPHGETK